MSRKHRDPYVRVGDRTLEDRVEYLIDPLDFLVLAELPKEGELIGGYLPLVRTVAALRREKFRELSSEVLAQRLRSMHVLGFTHRVKSAGGAGWQITPEGHEVLVAWRERKGGTS